MDGFRVSGESERGFTLIELAIVLVIVGLMVAGIIVGQSLIRQSQVNSVVIDEQKYVAASTQFQAKYNALPGDMATAVNYWGAAGGASTDNYTTSCYLSQGTGTQTCNGDGNSQLGNSATYYAEWLRFWQHLANAQFVQGTYTGVGDASSAYDHLPGVNCPKSRLEGGGFGIGWLGTQSGSGSYFDASYGNILLFGFAKPASGLPPLYPILTAAEALSIDTKYDDGAPGTGSIVAYKPAAPFAPSCATTGVASTAKYNVAAGGNVCSLIFVTGF